MDTRDGHQGTLGGLKNLRFPSSSNYLCAGRPQLVSPKVKKCAATPHIPSQNVRVSDFVIPLQNVRVSEGKHLPGLLVQHRLLGV